jgi:SAM-dependent methyltransferase
MERCAINDPTLLKPLSQDGKLSGRVYDGKFIQAFRCAHCAYIKFPSPSLATLESFYADEYPKSAVSWYNVKADYEPNKTKDRSNRILQLAAPFGLKPGAVLHEFGCAFGGTVAHLNSMGFDASGTELNAKAVSEGRAHGNAKIFSEDAVGYLERTGIRPDIIYSWHAIEHFSDPFSFLSKIKGLLAPKGILILIVPSAAARFALVYGHLRYVWFGYPEHLHLFSPGSAPGLAQRIGMKLLDVTSAEFGLEPKSTDAALGENSEAAKWLRLGDRSLIGEELIMIMANDSDVDDARADQVRQTQLKCETFSVVERQALEASERATVDPWLVR